VTECGRANKSLGGFSLGLDATELNADVLKALARQLAMLPEAPS